MLAYWDANVASRLNSDGSLTWSSRCLLKLDRKGCNRYAVWLVILNTVSLVTATAHNLGASPKSKRS